MAKQHSKTLAAAVGAAFLASASLSPSLLAGQNPFQVTELSGGYQVADNHEGKCGGKDKCEGKCGEGKCGEDKEMCEGKCGEGKCGEGMKGGEAAGAETKAEGEGKCGEGKCGEKME